MLPASKVQPCELVGDDETNIIAISANSQVGVWETMSHRLHSHHSTCEVGSRRLLYSFSGLLLAFLPAMLLLLAYEVLRCDLWIGSSQVVKVPDCTRMAGEIVLVFLACVKENFGKLRAHHLGGRACS